MKSAIFLTWFFTIVFFSHGLNNPGAGASCTVPQAGKQLVKSAAATPAMNALTPVQLPEEHAAIDMIPAAYAASEIEPAAAEPQQQRYNPRAQTDAHFGADAESYYQDKQDHLLQALMK